MAGNRVSPYGLGVSGLWYRARVGRCDLDRVLHSAGSVFALIAVEALNTAIECIVDHLASDWQEFARDAKDLGSLATMCMICANYAFIGSVIFRALAHA